MDTASGQRVHQRAAAHGPRTQAAATVLLGLALACVLAYSRAFVSGFGGLLLQEAGNPAGGLSFACSAARLLALVGLTALGALGRPFVSRPALAACGLLMVGSVLALSGGFGTDAAVCAAAVAGVCSGLAMLALMLLLAAQPTGTVVRAAFLGLLVGGLAIMLLDRLPLVPATALLIAAGIGAPACFVAVDPQLASCAPDEPGQRARAHDFPWFPALMFAVCGMFGSLLYGFSVQLGWGEGLPLPGAVMGGAVAGVLLLTTVLVLRGQRGTALVWLPLCVLLLGSTLLASFDVAQVNALAVALLMASVFCCHFLRWMVFPALIGQSTAPRVLTCGVLQILTNSFLNVSSGEALAQMLPDAMRAQGGVVSVVLLLLVCILCGAWVLDRRRMAVVAGAGDTAAEQEAATAVPARSEQAAMPQQGAERDGSAPVPAPAPRESEEDAAAEPSEAEAPDALEERCAALADAADLTPREREIFVLTARGYSSPFIAGQLVISDSTVRFHQRNVYAKLGVHSKQELIALANHEDPAAS